MKTVAFLLYMLSMCIMWLVTNIFVAVIGDMSYVEALRHPANMGLLLLLYWWPPLFVLIDYDKWLIQKGEQPVSNV